MRFFVFTLLTFIILFASLGIVFSIIYIFFFRPVRRPDYFITAGEYNINKMKRPIERKVFFYSAGQSILKGYFYPSKERKKLIVLCHGFRSGGDDFLPLIKQLVELG